VASGINVSESPEKEVMQDVGRALIIVAVVIVVIVVAYLLLTRRAYVGKQFVEGPTVLRFAVAWRSREQLCL
jgi:hypothetical protein